MRRLLTDRSDGNLDELAVHEEMRRMRAHVESEADTDKVGCFDDCVCACVPAGLVVPLLIHASLSHRSGRHAVAA